MADLNEKNVLIDITNINEKIYSLIKNRITHFEYPPGYPLNIRKLQAEFGVSNSPIKDALFRLAGEGLVEITSRKGTFVKDISERDLYEIEETRAILEGGAVEIIAASITDAQLKRLQSLYNETLIPEDKFEYSQFMEKDSRFHLEIITMTNNRRLLDVYKQLNAHVHITRFQYARNRKKPLPWTHQDHLDILAALKQRDPAKAKKAVQIHRIKARDAFLETRKQKSTQ
jgi:DNA-binding GntR family transcriptional regulator